jgi:hypothetical protein
MSGDSQIGPSLMVGLYIYQLDVNNALLPLSLPLLSPIIRKIQKILNKYQPNMIRLIQQRQQGFNPKT